ncbi:MAG: Crp/Fnr family transcriptional regulator [Liquorilactobacillus hordei]|uniref:Crp/Fnr family transcriptional regulator n=2 Tax=Liquorilactobacillus hordei TaxID=468911 RepID=A0A3Q8CDU1_9LACO|nr:Crp/Fnr family transcriptional regulator [Liquorilactobacillus hordei]AUJ30206.1 Crp/Fnr family transcriptional regulator [Liquorilactobacillus hordei]MBZ2406682.1 Crp/Fnr family transcriptional regulator [Liquorilactobacillus hordei]QYH52816.1 Crp/Fnr family transcriptional regulator [Liquorilactobacillus hordei DSM 19519]
MVMSHTEYLMNYLQSKKMPVIKKKKHTYLTYHGLEEKSTYVLKHGIVKTSIILQDGREFNLSYITRPDVLSLLRDEVSKYTDQPFNVRVESQEAEFYKIDRVKFWEMVNQDDELNNYVKEYYRTKLSENIVRLQRMIMGGKHDAVCAFLYQLSDLFGKRLPNHQGVLIDFTVTNEDIAGFCGINSRSSVTRILSDLREEGIIDIKNHKFIITNMNYLLDYVSI